jgi:hypothetical protein
MAISDLFEATVFFRIERRYHVIQDRWVDSGDSVCVVDHKGWKMGILGCRFYPAVPDL